MNHGNFDIQTFIDNQSHLYDDFNSVVTPQQNQQEIPDFSAEAIIDQRDDEKMKVLCNFTCDEFIKCSKNPMAYD